MPKIGCGPDKLQRTVIFKLMGENFIYSGFQIEIIAKEESDTKRCYTPNQESIFAENGVEENKNEWTRENDELETDFTQDSKSSQLVYAEQFQILRPKQRNDELTDFYLQYQPDTIKNFMKQLRFRYTDSEDDVLVVLINMVIDFRDVSSQHKLDIVQTKRIFLVTVKPV